MKNYASRSLKETFLTNPVTLILGVYFLNQLVCHVIDYFINLALNPDMETAFWVSNYGLPFFIKAILYVLFLFIILKVRSKKDNLTSDKEIWQACFYQAPVSAFLIILTVTVIGGSALRRFILHVTEKSLNYGIHSLQKVTGFEIRVLLFWGLVCLFALLLTSKPGSIIFSLFSVALVLAGLYFLVIVNISSDIPDGSLAEELITNQMISNAFEEAGVEKLFGMISLLNNPMGAFYKAAFIVTAILCILNWIVLFRRFKNTVAEKIAFISAIAVVILYVLSKTPVIDILTSGLSRLIYSA